MQLPEWDKINQHYLTDESELVDLLLQQAKSLPLDHQKVVQRSAGWVEQLRKQPQSATLHEAFMREYDLSSEEGILLMSLAEALLRIPDSATAQQLIHDYLSKGEWVEHLGHSPSNLVNMATWGLNISRKLVVMEDTINGTWQHLFGRMGRPVLQRAIASAMEMLGHQFVMGETISRAYKRASNQRDDLQCYSYDMLGEAAICEADVERYFDAYQNAIRELAESISDERPLMQRDGISVKLSALHARYEPSHCDQVLADLAPKLLCLAQQAKQAGISLTLDAEESDRLSLSLELFEQLYSDPSLAEWGGLGLALQAYQKRATAVVDWLIKLSEKHQRTIPIRLVKGAYWDSEIKLAQQLGLEGYPVFTRKQNTDLSYLVCAHKLLQARYIYCQFATHNAHTLCAVIEMARHQTDFEFQRLHGMGESLYQLFNQRDKALPIRVYAPVGGYHELLPYLVRRLLENGANSSFVNQIWDEKSPAEKVVADPVDSVESLSIKSHPKIPLPRAIYGDERENSVGMNLADLPLLREVQSRQREALHADYLVGPTGINLQLDATALPVFNPANFQQQLGRQYFADAQQLQQALTCAAEYRLEWSQYGVTKRAEILLSVAELLEDNKDELLALITAEAGRTLADGVSEVREAVDFCRYYACQATQQLGAAIQLPGPVGEENQLSWAPRGVFVTISPWNFPVAIFTGQIAAALVTGNTVLAKPAQQTPILAYRVVQLFHRAGVPSQALQLLPSSGVMISKHLLTDVRVAGVAFTGSTETAQHINQTLAQRKGAIAALVAETGGQNVMIADSSALPEHVVKDAIRSAFNSAGQRCSALRVLFLQQEVADSIISLLCGAMKELVVGDPSDIRTDVGPVIDESAYDKLVLHAAKLEAKGQLIYQAPLPEGKANGYFVAPSLFEIQSLDDLPHEVFGPMLHIIRYHSKDLESVMEQINNCGYGLTLGVHSRIESRINTVRELAHVGNLYVNRDMVGAVVGVQPFGGEGLSGTGFKAGGPHYLLRFCTERSVSINSAAIGGNTQLLNLED